MPFRKGKCFRCKSILFKILLKNNDVKQFLLMQIPAFLGFEQIIWRNLNSKEIPIQSNLRDFNIYQSDFNQIHMMFSLQIQKTNQN